MPRSLVLGNGTVLATFDQNLLLRDLYFPHVGMEEHTTYGNRHRIGMWVQDRGFSWLDDGSWRIQCNYMPETLIAHSTAVHEKFGIAITVDDCVHPVHNILIRQFHIETTDSVEKTVRLFAHHDFHIYGDKQKDTAFYEPHTNSVIHYRQTRYFLIGGDCDNPEICRPMSREGEYASVLRSLKHLSACGLSSFTVGKANYRGLEGTWRDAEDGALTENPIEQGSVDSTVGIYAAVKPGAATTVTLWLCLGTSLQEVVKLQQLLHEETVERLQRNCSNYWKSWVNTVRHDWGSLSPELINLYKRSLLTIRTHADAGGGIVAAADFDIMAFNRDTYTYVWPRDGAFVCMALDRAGHHEVTRRFLRFTGKILTEDGYLLHKYNPDGSLGSSWHPWYVLGEEQLPIQEDATALVLVALWRHFEAVQDFEFLQEMYETLVKRMAQFLCNFREPSTGLPLPSYDLWEEHRGVFTYTTGCTIAGLHAAAQICSVLGHYKHSERYQTAADEMRQALFFHLFDEKEQRFLKMIRRKDGVTVERDSTPDASIGILWQLGVLPPDDPRLASTMRQLDEHLRLKTGIGGLARYPFDRYHAAATLSREIPGNPWIITTLWQARWQIACAKELQDLLPAKQALEWTLSSASASGILPEQRHPLIGTPLSVAPLTWSHAVYVETVLQYIEKEKNLLR